MVIRMTNGLKMFASIISAGILSAIFATILWFIGINEYINEYLIIPLSTGLGLGVFFWFNRKTFFQKERDHVT